MSMATTALAEHVDTFPLLRRTELRNVLNEDQLRELERFCRSSTV